MSARNTTPRDASAAMTYVAEALHPDTGEWLYDSPNHSEHYNHSSFDDLVITGLIGLRPQPDDHLVVNPLVPDAWSYFALQDVSYHGHSFTIVWDRDGSHYGKGAGLAVYQDGALLSRSPTLTRLDLAVSPVVLPATSVRLANYACNATGADYPRATASYSNAGDDPSKAIDGKILYDDVPNSRWTNYQSPNAKIGSRSTWVLRAACPNSRCTSTMTAAACRRPRRTAWSI